MAVGGGMLFRVKFIAGGITWLDGDYRSWAAADRAIHRLLVTRIGSEWEYTITPRRIQ